MQKWALPRLVVPGVILGCRGQSWWPSRWQGGSRDKVALQGPRGTLFYLGSDRRAGQPSHVCLDGFLQGE